MRTRYLFDHTSSTHTGELEHSMQVSTAVATSTVQTAGLCKQALRLKKKGHICARNNLTLKVYFFQKTEGNLKAQQDH